MDIRQTLNHEVTEFDRKQEARAAKNPRAYHNVYALPQYLGRVADVCDDIDAGADPAAAIMRGFTPGPLRAACLKAIGAAANNTESVGATYLGMPVYAKVTAS
jgi:hypothetical protein